MERILIASKRAAAEKIEDILRGLGFTESFTVSDGSAARRMLGESEYALVIINAPLSDEFGRELAVRAAEKSYSGVVFICGSDTAYDIRDSMNAFGVGVIASPIRRSELEMAALTALETNKRIMSFRQSDKKARTRSEEIKLVSRAKRVLMESRGFTEPQAHRYIEKRAMDERRTRKAIALEITN